MKRAVTFALMGGVLIVLVVVGVQVVRDGGRIADPTDAKQVALGKVIYTDHCVSCHGAALEGQPEWQTRKPDGRLPAPPHDASGHTWHHADDQLFGIIKNGIGAYAPPGYESDMPAFGSTLSDEQIYAVLAYIKSNWPVDIQFRQAEVSRRAKR